MAMKSWACPRIWLAMNGLKPYTSPPTAAGSHPAAYRRTAREAHQAERLTPRTAMTL